MALAPLAAAADLAARGVDTTDTARVNAALAAASAAIRDAAGVPISRHTSTVNLWADGNTLALPGQPVISVTSVTVEGAAVTGWKLVDGRLWRSGGWYYSTPTQAVVTYIHGYAEVPADIVDLTCSVAAAGLEAMDDGFASPGADQIAAIDDVRFHAPGEDTPASPYALHRATRDWLRQRFSGAVATTGASR